VEGILRPPSGTTSFDCCKLFQLAVLLVAFTSAKLPTRVSIARRRTVEGEEAPIFISEASKLDPDQTWKEEGMNPNGLKCGDGDAIEVWA